MQKQVVLSNLYTKYVILNIIFYRRPHMKKLSTTLLADIVQSKRKSLNMTQAQLSELTGINRAQLSRLEQEDYCPLIPQLEKLGDVLDFDINDVFVNTAASKLPSPSPLHIAVAGT